MTYNKLTVFFLSFVMVFFSFLGCKKEPNLNVGAPLIAEVEIGTNNSNIAYAGQDLHVEAMLDVPRKIANIKLQITPVVSGPGFSFSETYEEGYAGIKKTEFHEHIDIPDHAKAGDYNLLLIVTDALGTRTLYKSILKIVKDASLPNISDLQVNLTSGNASEVTIKGIILAPNKIAKLMVELQSVAWTREYIFSDADMVGNTSYHLDKRIDISAAPNGHYHVNITLLDQVGKRIVFSYHTDKK